MSDDIATPAPARARRRALKKAEPTEAVAVVPERRRRRTGAGSLVNPDNIVLYWITIGVLGAAAVASLVESVEGLLHVGGWYLPFELQWTLPFALDGFMIGTFLANLALRRRHAYVEATVLTVMTALLVLFSCVANFLQAYLVADPSTLEGQASPWIKGAMPLLVFAAFEAIAMLTSTRKQGEHAPLRVAQAEVKKLRAELKQARRANTKATAVAPAPVEAVAVQS